jgi:hypothetical protein
MCHLAHQVPSHPPVPRPFPRMVPHQIGQPRSSRPSRCRFTLEIPTLAKLCQMPHGVCQSAHPAHPPRLPIPAPGSVTSVARRSSVHIFVHTVTRTALQRVELASARLSVPVATPAPSRRHAPARTTRLDNDTALDVLPSFRAASPGDRQRTADNGVSVRVRAQPEAVDIRGCEPAAAVSRCAHRPAWGS